MSPDEKTIAVCSDEIEIKLVNRHDIEQITMLKEHPKPIKHLAYNPSGDLLAASCTDGKIYVYSLSSVQPSLYRTIDGVIQRLETNDAATSKCAWHPDSRAFACATATRDIVVVSVEDGAQQRSFKGGHMGEITSIAWSPNGALLASSSADDQLVIWETKTQKELVRFNYEKILDIAFQNGTENIFNWTNTWGEVYIIYDFLKDPEHLKLLKGSKVRAPFFHDPLDERTAVVNGRKPLVNGQGRRAQTPDSLDEMLRPNPNIVNELDFDWIEDDDGAGYTNGNGKRTNGHLPELNGHVAKRPMPPTAWQPQIHEPFQPGATPWSGNRKYLCLNLTGFVWTVDQDTHNTVTVEFYDRETHRDFHFTDPFRYDKACLTEHGTLFSCPGSDGVNGQDREPAMIFYRPHEIWTGTRTDARIRLPRGEEVVCIALGHRYIIAVTNVGYVRVWTLFGVAVKIWRMKTVPAVCCAASGDHVMVVGNGGVAADGCTQLSYSVENIRTGEVYQSEDLIALGAPSEDGPDFGDGGASLKTLFWSDEGDPCTYDSNGVLCVLTGWRQPGQARWVPLLDTRLLDRLRDGRKEETYWPVAVAQEKFHCIILKGGDRYPYFPRPLLSEFDLRIPVNEPPPPSHDHTTNGGDDSAEETNAAAGARLEESFVRHSTLLTLAEDTVGGGDDTHAAKTEVLRREIEVDKLLLQLLAVECREGEERGMKALEVVKLMRDPAGKMVEAAAKIAGRYGRGVLEDKIREWAEARILGVGS